MKSTLNTLTCESHLRKIITAAWVETTSDDFTVLGEDDLSYLSMSNMKKQYPAFPYSTSFSIFLIPLFHKEKPISGGWKIFMKISSLKEKKPLYQVEVGLRASYWNLQ